MNWFWLSYCDPQLPAGSRFLGACVVGPADSFLGAMALAHVHGCNPMGEVQGIEIPREIEPRIPAAYRNRLLSRAECEGFDAIVGWGNN